VYCLNPNINMPIDITAKVEECTLILALRSMRGVVIWSLPSLCRSGDAGNFVASDSLAALGKLGWTSSPRMWTWEEETRP
jgi:hypothetical protein